MKLVKMWKDTIKYRGLIINKPVRHENPELH